MTLLLAHAAATCFLTGLVWVVQLVVYPSFLRVGRTAAWPAFHAQHSRGMTRAVVLPWAVEGVCCAVLLVRRPDGVPLWLAGLAGALGLATVVLTFLVQVPLHGRLSRAYDERAARRLLASNRLRVLAWTGAAATGLAMLAVLD